jgi:dephospho-CoA kinase
MLHVGLTGNIATGKSHVAAIFAELGAHIVDADVISHELLAPDTPTCHRIVEAFGRGILTPEGFIDRRALGKVVFEDPDKRALLNSIVHPEVRNEVLRRIVELEKGSEPGIVMVDAALMVESGFYKAQDFLIVVKCHPSMQLSRVIARDGLSEEEARARIAAQMPIEEKAKLADYTIETSGTFRHTRDQVEEIYRSLLLEEIRLRDHPES